jgi:hypothetical protein
MANGGTNVPSIAWGTTGPQAPSGPAVLAGVQADIQAAFGTTLSFNLNTPQGQIASSEAAIINDTNQLIVYYANQTNPSFAQGRMQDAIAAIYFITRNPALSTTLQVVCTGADDVVIPTGTLVVDSSNNLYGCVTGGTIPSSGSITLSFAALTPGPLPVPTTLSIYNVIGGWDTAGVASGVVGQNTETSQQLELRRSASVAGNSVSQNGAILGAVLGVPGVLDAYVTDNPSNEPVTIGGVAIPANTLYVAVTGGTAAAVASAIWSKKPPGIPLYSGNASQVVQDPNPAYSPPAPSYTITWEIPTALQVYFSIVVAQSAQIPSNATQLIQQAVVTAFQGGVAIFTGAIADDVLTVSAVEQGALGVGQLVSGAGVAQDTFITGLGTGAGGIGTYILGNSQAVASTLMVSAPPTNVPVPPRARIGSVIYANQYGALIGALGSWAAVKSILVGSANVPAANVVGFISGDVLTVLSVNSGTLAVGQFLNGNDDINTVPPGTQISNLQTGTGGTGTYLISSSFTLAGASFVGTSGSGPTANQLTASSVSGSIGVGDIIIGSGIPGGTTIISQLSGTIGGAGVYETSVNTTATAQPVTCAVTILASAANQNYAAVNINQEPQITTSNVEVTYQ